MKNLFIGIDFSKETFDATIICSSMMITSVHEKFENKPSGFSKLRTWIRKNSYGTTEENWLLCGENTGVYCQNMCDWMFAKGIDIWIENALQIKRSLGLKRGKNDKADSANIAEYASRFIDKMKPYVPDSKEIKELRGIFMRRRTFSKMRKQLKNEHQEKIKVLGKDYILHGIAACSEKIIKNLEDAIKKCDKMMCDIINSSPELKKTFDIVTSIKGISLQNGVAMIVYTNNFSKFENVRQMLCFWGVAPFEHSSGTSVHGRTQTSFFANKMLKELISDAAANSIRFNDKMKKYYNRLLNRGKIKGVALNNVKAKLINIVFTMVQRGTIYDPNYDMIKITNKQKGEVLKNAC